MKGVEVSLVLIIAVVSCALSQPLLSLTGKESDGNPDCTSDQTCANVTYVDLCEGICGVNAFCVETDPPLCSCKPGFNGDPLVACESLDGMECTEDAKCPLDKACVNNHCVDPCQDNDVCGLNTDCRTKNHRPVCSCSRKFTFTQGQGCKPISIPECLTNSNCPKDLSCRQQKCVDPCQKDVCGNNTICSVKNHFPVCACEDGYMGDAIHECVPFDFTKKKSNGTSYVISNSKMEWFDALSYCASKGMRLAMVKNAEQWENLLLTWEAKKYDDTPFWLGAHDFGENFRWATTGEPLTFDNWEIDEPIEPHYHCLKVTRSFGWIAYNCSRRYYFACEII